MRLISLSLTAAGLVAPLAGESLYEEKFSDIHDIGPLSDSPVRNSPQIIWTLEHTFGFYIPKDSVNAKISFILHAPYGGFAKPTNVTLAVGRKKRLITVNSSYPVSMTVRRGQLLSISVERCVVPAIVDPGSPDTRSLCVGLSMISASPSAFGLRYWENLW